MTTNSSTPIYFPQISQIIWNEKYAYKTHSGENLDRDFQGTFRRVAKAIAKSEHLYVKDEEDGKANATYMENVFFSAMSDFSFMPGGRILSGAGTDRNVTLMNCFVMGTMEDSMIGIMQHLTNSTITLRQGGGIGIDFSPLRPRKSHVKGVDAEASGAVSFMDIWHAMCGTLMSAGMRRGAMMAVLRIDHPDILEFIRAKHTPGRLTNFNLSVAVTDDFIQAVEADGSFPLVFEGKVHKYVSARDLWNELMRSTYDYAEPGVLFIDRINQNNNLYYCEQISATNPCGEQPLPPYASCLLGNVNLTKVIVNPCTRDAKIDFRKLARITEIGVHFLDNVIDQTKYPMPEFETIEKERRRMGLGIAGLANALFMLGLKYSSPEGRRAAAMMMRCVQFSAMIYSVQLAIKRGAFPAFDANKYLAGTHMQKCIMQYRDDCTLFGLPGVDLGEQIRQFGIRNSHLSSIQPTGTTALFAGNISGGMEPVFSTEYSRTVIREGGGRDKLTIQDYGYSMWKAVHPTVPLPDTYETAESLDLASHVQMQSVLQDWVDGSISKTINCPADISFDQFKEVYIQAWLSGCKGCTTYRPSGVRGAILETIPKKEEPAPAPAKEEPAAPAEPKPHPLAFLRPRHAISYKIKWPGDEAAYYIFIVHDEQNIPRECFIHTKAPEHHQWISALTRMVSAVLRTSSDPMFIAQELQEIFDPRGGTFIGMRYTGSVISVFGRILEHHLLNHPIPSEVVEVQKNVSVPPAPTTSTSTTHPACPKCGAAIVFKEGCQSCSECSYSKCG